jgi:hypothetical protein
VMAGHIGSNVAVQFRNDVRSTKMFRRKATLTAREEIKFD